MYSLTTFVSTTGVGIDIVTFSSVFENLDKYSQSINFLTGVASLVGGAISVATGVGSIYGGGAIIHGATSIARVINNDYVATLEPNRSNVAVPKNNLLTAMKQNTFDFYIKRIKKNYARSVDDYFTMFGYKVNELKVPNIFNRPHFTYVQLSECNMVGAIPNDDMNTLKSIFINGATFWNMDPRNRCWMPLQWRKQNSFWSFTAYNKRKK